MIESATEAALGGLAERAAQVAWLVDFLDDVESDLSVYHRVDDMWSLPADRFFRLAERLVSYDGALRYAVSVVIEADKAGPAVTSNDGRQPAAVPDNPAVLGTHDGTRAYPESGFPAVFEVKGG